MADQYYNSIYTGEEIDRRLGLAGEAADAVIFDGNNDTLWAVGSINVSTGNNASNANRLRTRYPIGKGFVRLEPASGWMIELLAWNGSTYVGAWNGTNFAKRESWRTEAIDLSELSTFGYDYKVLLSLTTPAAVSLADYVNLVMIATTDSSLTLPGRPADAEAVGEKIRFFGANIGTNQDLDSYTDEGWYYWLSSANPAHNPTSEAGTMRVYGVSASNAVQVVYSRGTTQRMFWRLKTTTAWTEWKTLAYETEIDEITASLAAADALAKSGLPIWGAPALEWIYGTIINSNGTISNSYVYSAISEFVPVSEGDILVGATPATYDGGSGERSVTLYVSSYDSTQTHLNRRTLAYGSAFTIPAGTAYIRFSCSFTQSEGYLYSMTRARLLAIFGVASGKPLKGSTDRPVYAAIGASTTVGAVHHFTGQSISYSARAYPDYVGAVLKMRTANLGIGTTGFLARNSGENRNFMDQIYDRGSVLSEASLVTIMFAYGNDNGVGLPVGEWDDYFPYDQNAHFFVEGDASGNVAGITAMLNEGATLFGCLNWCIKWIGEHYPRAQLVVVMGYPADNAEHSVVVSSAEGRTAPMKITVNRSASSLSTKLAQLRAALNIPMIDLISDGLPFSYYASRATETDGNYAIFSTTGTAEEPTWNSHPNEDGYLMYARYLAGRISAVFQNYG